MAKVAVVVVYARAKQRLSILHFTSLQWSAVARAFMMR